MKKTLATITLAIVMTFGATFANAGILISDAPAPAASTDREGIIVFGRDGIIVFGYALSSTGIIVFG